MKKPDGTKVDYYVDKILTLPLRGPEILLNIPAHTKEVEIPERQTNKVFNRIAVVSYPLSEKSAV